MGRELTLEDLTKIRDINWNEFPIIDWRNFYTTVEFESAEAVIAFEKYWNQTIKHHHYQ